MNRTGSKKVVAMVRNLFTLLCWNRTSFSP